MGSSSGTNSSYKSFLVLNSPLAAKEGALAGRLEPPRDNRPARVPSFFSIVAAVQRMKSIFIAEGNQSVARLFAAVFAHHNWKVTLSGFGNHAEEALRGSEHYDVVLVSYEGHGMNGVELTRLVRALEHRKHTPVVMVTGSIGIEVEAFNAGVNEVLHKPIDIYGLIAIVSKYISEARHQEMIP